MGQQPRERRGQIVNQGPLPQGVGVQDGDPPRLGLAHHAREQTDARACGAGSLVKAVEVAEPHAHRVEVPRRAVSARGAFARTFGGGVGSGGVRLRRFVEGGGVSAAKDARRTDEDKALGAARPGQLERGRGDLRGGLQIRGRAYTQVVRVGGHGGRVNHIVHSTEVAAQLPNVAGEALEPPQPLKRFAVKPLIADDDLEPEP